MAVECLIRPDPPPPDLIVTSDGRTALHLASDAADAETLLECGADLHHRDAFGMLPLHLAAARNDADVCGLLLRRAPLLAFSTDNAGNTPLHWATRSSQTVHLLVDYGSPVNARNKMGETAAMHACVQGRCDVVASLLPRVADVNAADHKCRTMLMIASQYGFGDIADLLLQHGADPNRRDLAGWTALHFAALGAWPQRESHPKLMRLLLNHGANPSLAEASSHWQAMHVATDASAVRVLHEFGADVSAVDRDGRTPAHYVSAEAVAELHRLGADIDRADRYGRTPLHTVASEEKTVVLHAFGADVNAVDHEGKTPLDWSQYRMPVADALRRMGAKPGLEVSRAGRCAIS